MEEYIIFGRTGCGYTIKAREDIKEKGVFYEVGEVRESEDKVLKRLLNRASHHTTVPKIFRKNDKSEDGYRFIGGYENYVKQK